MPWDPFDVIREPWEVFVMIDAGILPLGRTMAMRAEIEKQLVEYQYEIRPGGIVIVYGPIDPETYYNAS